MKTRQVVMSATIVSLTVSGIAGHLRAQEKVNAGEPHVSPDGSSILFHSNRSGKFQIYRMPATGGQAVQLTTDPRGAHSPAWSSDGRKIVFVSTDATGDAIVIADADGTHRTVVDVAPGNQGPQWMPNGRQILFASGNEPNLNLYLVNLDGSNRRNIAPNSGTDYDPAVSPDGKKVAFVSRTSTRGARLMLMDIDGRNRREASSTDGALEQPAWSPDGTRLAFQVKVGESRLDGYLHVLYLDGGPETHIWSARSYTGDSAPSWLPDSRTLVFQSPRSGSWELYSLPVGPRMPQQRTPQQLTPE
jgi:Tol biopolymer transport system component